MVAAMTSSAASADVPTAAKGHLYVISAPSGAGKTSLVAALLEDDSHIRLAVSHTTRAPRPGEQEGVHYYFVDLPTFHSMVEKGAFLEHAEVFGNRYGTSSAAVAAVTESGTDVILEIDWQGAEQVRRLYPGATSIFILPPSPGALRQRLLNRAQDDLATIERRLQAALAEIRHFDAFDFIVVNETFDVALKDLKAIFRARRLARERQHGTALRLIEAFSESQTGLSTGFVDPKIPHP